MAVRSDGAKRRDAVLDAALRCFVERGILATGIEEIRIAAGASPSSVYHLFGGLPGILQALSLRTFERLFHHLGARVSRATTAQEAVTSLVRGHLDWVFANRDEARFMYEATAIELAPAEAQALLTRKAVLLEPVTRRFGALIASGQLPAWTPLQFDVVLLGPSHEACRRFLAGAPLTRAWMTRTLPELAWNSVRLEPRKASGPSSGAARSRSRRGA